MFTNSETPKNNKDMTLKSILKSKMTAMVNRYSKIIEFLQHRIEALTLSQGKSNVIFMEKYRELFKLICRMNDPTISKLVNKMLKKEYLALK
jgi:thiamine kinase-like enzyme